MKMARKQLWRAWVVVAVVTLAAAAGRADLIVNGGFEDGSGSSADNWNQFGNAFRDTRSAQTGSYGISMFGNFSPGPNYSGAYQDTNAVAGELFQASVYVSTTNSDQIGPGDTAFLKLEFYDANTNFLTSFAADNPLTNTSLVDTWMLQSVSATAPVDSAFVRTTLIFEQDTGAGGSAFFDNATLEAVPEPSTMLLFAVGGVVLYRGHRRLTKRGKNPRQTGEPTRT
jgi:hypothetical protein